MIHLLFLRLSLSIWRRTLSVSRKLSGRTWLALAVIHTAIASVAFGAYFAKSVPDSAIPPVYYVDTNLMSASYPPCTEIARRIVCWSERDLIVAMHSQYIDFLPRFPDEVVLTTTSMPPDRRLVPDPPQVDAHNGNGAANTTRFNGSGSTTDSRQAMLRMVTQSPNLPSELFYGDIKVKPLRLRPSSIFERLTESAAMTSSVSSYCAIDLSGQISGYNHLSTSALAWHDLSRWLPKIPVSSDQIAFQLQKDAPNLLTPMQQLVAILVGIFSTFFAALNAFFAWQVYRRAKAQEILTQLQIAKLRAEIAEYEAKVHKERIATGIILVS